MGWISSVFLQNRVMRCWGVVVMLGSSIRWSRGVYRGSEVLDMEVWDDGCRNLLTPYVRMMSYDIAFLRATPGDPREGVLDGWVRPNPTLQFSPHVARKIYTQNPRIDSNPISVFAIYCTNGISMLSPLLRLKLPNTVRNSTQKDTNYTSIHPGDTYNPNHVPQTKIFIIIAP